MAEKLDFTGIDAIQPIKTDNSAVAAQPLSETDLQDIDKELKNEATYGDSELSAAALGAARGASLGFSDQFFAKSGLIKSETLKELKKRNEISSLIGETAGSVAPLLTSGGVSAVIGAPVRAASRLGTAAEQALGKLLLERGTGLAAKKIVQQALPRIIGSGVEGAALGSGQLISEDALGTSELNAENALAHAGLGGLLGAAAGGIFSAPAALLSKTDKAGNIIGKKLQTISDPTDAALDLIGATAANRTKLKTTSKDLVENLPTWLVDKAKLGAFTGSETLKNNIHNIKKTSGEKIGNIMTAIDDAAVVNPNILPSGSSVYGNIAKSIDDNIVKVYENTPGFKQQLNGVKELRDEYINLGKLPGSVKASELHDLRKKTDALIKFDKQPGTYTLKEKTLYDIRNKLNDIIDDTATAAQASDIQNSYGSLFSDLKSTNKDYSYATKILPYMEKKIESANAKRGIFNLSDLVLGGASINSLGDGIGGMVVAGKKLLEGDLRRRVAILSAVEKQNKLTDQKITNGIKAYISSEPVKKVVRIAPTSLLLNSPLSLSKNNDKPSNKKEAYTNFKNNLIELQNDPDKLQMTIAKRTMGLSQAAPNTAFAAATKASTALQFLQSKLPLPATDNSLDTLFKRAEKTPSELEMAKFERYLQAVENPLSAIDQLQEGKLTHEAAEAIKTVYPELFQKMQNSVTDQLSKTDKQISYNKKIQLSLLLDIPTDQSLQPANIAGLQSNFPTDTGGSQPQQTSNSAQPNPSASSLDMAERTQTQQNRIAQR